MMSDGQALEIRPAHSSDSNWVPQLIVESDPELFRFCGNNSLEPWLQVAKAEFEACRGFYSYLKTKILLVDGSVAGMIISLPICRASETDWDLRYSQQVLDRDLWAETADRYRSVDNILFPEVPSEAYYIQNLAILGRYRQRGFGRILMGLAEAEGYSAECTHISVDVNAGATSVSFYEHLGYETTTITDCPHHDLLRYCRMRKNLCHLRQRH